MSQQNNEKTSHSFHEFLGILKTLRGPSGCPWDKEQTPASMRGYLLEEVYELLEAMSTNDPVHVREELGDVLLIIGMLCLMYAEKGLFHIDEVLDEINAKLIRRHPHVFGNVKAGDAEEALKNWERIKTDIEGRAPINTSALDGIPRSSPPLERAYTLQKKAARKGFDWTDSEGPRKKILEELDEIAIAEDTAQLEEEVGDLLFSVVNYSRLLNVDPVVALLRGNAKFEKRFRHVEQKMNDDGVPLTPDNIDRINTYWESAKETL